MEKRLPLSVGTVLQGRYRIVRQLGHGGFGAVYEAVDDELNLSFALKETFYAADEQLRQAFKREARLLARLSHDAFPRVSHYFTEGDGCFLVMELVPGDDLDKLLSRRSTPFDEQQVLSWADQILDALEDLHSSGIVHRDIKPSNLKLTPKGKIKLLDFGIAKATLEGETSVLTTVGSLAAATLQYAPLEQVLKASQQYQLMLSVVSPEKVMETMRQGTDARSDVYALGATLYQLLTKQLPADAPTRALAIWSGQTDRLIAADEVNREITRTVSEVLQKALELDQQERLSTAAEMRRMLSEAGKPAGPTSFAPPETVRVADGFVQPATIQHPPPFGIEPKKHDLHTEVTQWRELSKPFPKTKTPVGLYAVLIAVPLFFLIIGVIGLGLYLASPGNTSSGNNSKSENPVVSTNYELAQTLTGHKNTVEEIEFSPDGKTFASSSFADDILIWDLASLSLKETILWAKSPAFSKDGKYFAYSGGNRLIGEKLTVRQTATGSLVEIAMSNLEPFNSIKFSSDGTYIYYIQANKEIPKSYEPYQIPILGGTPKKLINDADSAIFSPDNKIIVSANESSENKVSIWDTASGALNQTLVVGFSGSLFGSAISPDNKTLAYVGGVEINLWDINSATLKQTLKSNEGLIKVVAFSSDGKMIASGNLKNSVTIWDAASGRLLQTLTGHGAPVNSLAFSPDGKTLVSGSSDNTLKVWRVK